MSADIVREFMENVRQKIGYARRSVERMEASIATGAAADAQDHFWSFINASKLHWFYLGKVVNELGLAKGTAGQLVDEWKANLSSAEMELWETLSEMRNADVHVSPVEAQKKLVDSGLLYQDGSLLMSGDRLAYSPGVTKWLVSFDGREHEVQPFSRKALHTEAGQRSWDQKSQPPSWLRSAGCSPCTIRANEHFLK